MHCERLNDPKTGELIAIVCGRRVRKARCTCSSIAGLQCDWKVGGGKTCDAWICGACAQEVGPNKHLCPEHQRMYKDWLAKRVESRITNHESPG
jgi:hypothetical protein